MLLGAGQISLKWVVFAVVATANIPLIALALFLISVAQHGAVVSQQYYALSIARQLAAGVDSELETYIATLEALSSAPALQAGDLAAFYAQATDVARRRGNPIVVRERGGQQVLNTLRRLGADLPRTQGQALLDADERAWQSGTAIVSNLYDGVTTGEPHVAVVLPVNAPIEGRTAPLTLTLGISAKRLSDLLARSVPADVTAAIVGSDGRVAARSKDSERYVGQQSVGVQYNPAVSERLWDGATLNGDAVIAAQVRLKNAAWHLVVGIPHAALLDVVPRRSIVVAVPIFIVALLTTALIAVVLAQWVVSPLRNLHALPEGKHPKPSGVLEFDALGASLAKGFERQRALLREVNHRSGNLLSVVQAMARLSPTTHLDLVQRVSGLATTQKLLVDADWQVVDLKALIDAHIEQASVRGVLTGPTVKLGPSTAQALGIAFAELAANASSHTSPLVTVTWSYASSLELIWEEPRTITSEEQSGFGYTLLTRITAQSVDGTADYGTPDQLRWRLWIPAESISR